MSPNKFSDLGPIELFSHRPYCRQQSTEVAVLLGHAQQPARDDLAGSQNGDVQTENLLQPGASHQVDVHRNRVDPMQHVHHGSAKMGFEQPVLRGPLDLEPSPLQAIGGRLDVRLGHHEVDVVDRFGSAVGPQSVAAGERESDVVLLQR